MAAMSLPRTGRSPLRLPAASLLAASAALAALLLAPEPASALRLSQIGTFDQPVHVEDAPGKKNRHLLFVVEKPGRVIVLRNGAPKIFLDLTDLVLGPEPTEQGLLSIAFHPEYERNRLFYVYLTEKSGDNAIYEFKRAKKSRVRGLRFSARRVLHIPHPDLASNHNGGQLQFDREGLLYAAPGDGGAISRTAQDLNDLNGKLLRIDPLKQTKRGGRKKGAGKSAGGPYGIPADNPFVGKPGRDEIYSLGLRNPYRFSFDRVTGAIVIADVGAGTREEVNYIPSGRPRGVNFGWPRFEGTVLMDANTPAPGAIYPIFDYDHSGGRCSITGGFVIRDRRLASMVGRYLYADFCGGEVRSLVPAAGIAIGDAPAGLPEVQQPSSFGEGRRGVIFLASLMGPVYRLDP
jgi:glucose/arabinose dehydrogenase